MSEHRQVDRTYPGMQFGAEPGERWRRFLERVGTRSNDFPVRLSRARFVYLHRRETARTGCRCERGSRDSCANAVKPWTGTPQTGRARQTFWQWFAVGVLVFCWAAEATMCAQRGF